MTERYENYMFREDCFMVNDANPENGVRLHQLAINSYEFCCVYLTDEQISALISELQERLSQ
ncbi:MAG: hypothetical protein V7727_19280 [Sneathiella sp.]